MGAAHALDRLGEDAARTRSTAGPTRCAHGRPPAAQPFPDAALVGPRVRELYNDAYRPIPGASTRSRWARSGAGMLGRDLAHRRPDGRGAVPRRRPATFSDDLLLLDGSQGVPRGDALQGRVQPGSRRDRRPRRRRARHGRGDDRAVCRREAAPYPARACRARRRRRPSRRARMRPRCAERERRATRRSRASTCSTRTGDRRTLVQRFGMRDAATAASRAVDYRARPPAHGWPLVEARRAADRSSWTTFPRASVRCPAARWAEPPHRRSSLPLASPEQPRPYGFSSCARQPAPRARRRLPRLLRAGRRAGRDGDPQRARATRRSGGAPRRWPRSIARRRSSSATSATSSGRR